MHVFRSVTGFLILGVFIDITDAKQALDNQEQEAKRLTARQKAV